MYIPKPGSENKRPLGIPAVEDKIVQEVMTQVLNAIYEPMFKKFSFGFRPGRSCHQAIAYLGKNATQRANKLCSRLRYKRFL